ncbi:hypothetical protein ACHAO8_010319 [Botrytis cinerea]
MPSELSNASCEYVGNSDIYGLGIRVGIYLQWVASILSKTFLEEKDIYDVLNESSIFLVAIFVATILLITNFIEDAHNVDTLIMLHIFFGTTYIVFYDLRVMLRIKFVSSGVNVLIVTCVIAGMSIFGVWFWFSHIRASEVLNNECEEFAFFFGRVKLLSQHSVMSFRAFSIINIMAIPLPLIASVIGAVLKFKTTTAMAPPSIASSRDVSLRIRNVYILFFKPLTPSFMMSGITERQSFFIFEQFVAQKARSGLLTTISIFIYSVTAIELLIRYNNIKGVYTLLNTGQIIPFTIGIAGLRKVTAKISGKFLRKKNRSNLFVDVERQRERSVTPDEVVIELEDSSPNTQIQPNQSNAQESSPS